MTVPVRSAVSPAVTGDRAALSAASAALTALPPVLAEPVANASLSSFLSECVTGITYSATLQVNEKITALQKAGIDIIHLGFGEADYPTPTLAAAALQSPAVAFTNRYTEVAGTPELRQAIADAQRHGFYFNEEERRITPLQYDPSDIIVSVGSKHLIYSAIIALCNPYKDEVVLHAPYWVSFSDMAILANARVNSIRTTEEDGFRLRPDVLEEALTPASKLLILNTPNNPTGVVFSRKDLKGIVDVALAHNLFVLSDEIYGLLTYDGAEHISIASVGGDEFRERCIVTSGLSKAYAMGGWRIGYALVKNKELYAAMVKIASNTVSCAPSVTQDACWHAFRAVDHVRQMRQDFQQRKNLMVKRLREIGFEVVEPQGAFYLFPNVSAFFGTAYNGMPIRSSADFSLALLEEGVASLPGSAFGADSNIRLAYVRPLERLAQACDRMERFVKKLT